MKLSIMLAAVAGISLVVSPTWAADTCTSRKEGCYTMLKNMRYNPKLCDVQWGHCMRTGHWWGPVTNANYGDVEKK